MADNPDLRLLLELLQRYAHLPSSESASKVGLRTTALKKLCRLVLDLENWQDLRRSRSKQAGTPSSKNSCHLLPQLEAARPSCPEVAVARAPQHASDPLWVITPENSGSATWWADEPARDVLDTAVAGGEHVGPVAAAAAVAEAVAAVDEGHLGPDALQISDPDTAAAALFPAPTRQRAAAEPFKQSGAPLHNTSRPALKSITLSFAPAPVVIKIAGPSVIQPAAGSPGTPSSRNCSPTQAVQQQAQQQQQAEQGQQEQPAPTPIPGPTEPDATLAACLQGLAKCAGADYMSSLRQVEEAGMLIAQASSGWLLSALSLFSSASSALLAPGAHGEAALAAGGHPPLQGHGGSIAAAVMAWRQLQQQRAWRVGPAAVRQQRRWGQPQQQAEQAWEWAPTLPPVVPGASSVGVGPDAMSWGRQLPPSRQTQPFRNSLGSAFTPYKPS